MKFVALLIALCCILPLSIIIRGNRRIADIAWISIGFLPFLLPAIPQLDLGIVTLDEVWHGYSHGVEVSFVDSIALAILFSLPKTKNVLWFHVPLAFYLFALVLAWFQAAQPLAAFFYIFQFAKVYLLIVVIARGCEREDVPLLLMKGFALGLALQLLTVVLQVVSGAYIQPPGTFSHQNTLGMALHLAAIPSFAMFLAGARGWQFLIAPPAALLVAALTASRASLGVYLGGLCLAYLLSLLRGVSKRKLATGLTGFVLLLVAVPVAISSFERRFEATPLGEDTYDERAAFNRAAMMIVGDHPWGVGSNHYVYTAKNFGYSLRAGVIPVEGNLNNIVHNAYLLAAVETGYIGLAAFLLLCFYPLFISWQYARVAGSMLVGDLLAGIAAALVAVYLHSAYEYILFGKDMHYLFGITLGIVFGTATRLAVHSTGPVEPEKAVGRVPDPARG